MSLRKSLSQILIKLVDLSQFLLLLLRNQVTLLNIVLFNLLHSSNLLFLQLSTKSRLLGLFPHLHLLLNGFIHQVVFKIHFWSELLLLFAHIIVNSIYSLQFLWILYNKHLQRSGHFLLRNFRNFCNNLIYCVILKQIRTCRKCFSTFHRFTQCTKT